MFITRISRAESGRVSLEPTREAASARLGVDIWAGTGKQVDASRLGGLEERDQVKDAGSVELALLALDQCPIRVKRDSVVAQCLDLLEYIQIEACYRETEGVILSAVEHDAFASDEQRVLAGWG